MPRRKKSSPTSSSANSLIIRALASSLSSNKRTRRRNRERKSIKDIFAASGETERRDRSVLGRSFSRSSRLERLRRSMRGTPSHTPFDRVSSEDPNDDIEDIGVPLPRPPPSLATCFDTTQHADTTSPATLAVPPALDLKHTPRLQAESTIMLPTFMDLDIPPHPATFLPISLSDGDSDSNSLVSPPRRAPALNYIYGPIADAPPIIPPPREILADLRSGKEVLIYLPRTKAQLMNEREEAERERQEREAWIEGRELERMQARKGKGRGKGKENTSSNLLSTANLRSLSRPRPLMKTPSLSGDTEMATSPPATTPVARPLAPPPYRHSVSPSPSTRASPARITRELSRVPTEPVLVPVYGPWNPKRYTIPRMMPFENVPWDPVMHPPWSGIKEEEGEEGSCGTKNEDD